MTSLMTSGQMTSDNISLLITGISEERNDAIHHFTSNQDTDRYNRERLNSIPIDNFNSEAIDSVKSAELSSEQRNRCVEQARALKT